MDVLSNRIQKAVESVLENESLLDGLDEMAASALQDWGIQNVKRIAEETGNLDDEQAEESMYPKMKASRSLMRAIRVWIETERQASADERAQLWAKIEKQAQDLYDAELHLPDAATFSSGDPAAFIKELLAWLERYTDNKENAKKGFFQSFFLTAKELSPQKRWLYRRKL